MKIVKNQTKTGRYSPLGKIMSICNIGGRTSNFSCPAVGLLLTRYCSVSQEEHIDMLGSDHSPSVPDLKLLEEGNFLKAWGGISSLQVLTQASNSYARNRDKQPWTSSVATDLDCAMCMIAQPYLFAVCSSSDVVLWAKARANFQPVGEVVERKASEASRPRSEGSVSVYCIISQTYDMC